jgi:glycogen(starch) synthase
MHVLITSDTVGGVWTYTQELVSGLAARGHRVTLVSFGKLPGADQATWLRNLANVDYRPTEYRLEWMEVAERDIEESRRYLEFLVREVQPDVLHFNQYCYGDIDVDVPRIVVAHSDVVSWWVAVHGSEPDDTPWMHRYREHVTNGLGASDMVLAPSQWMLDAVTRHYLAPSRGTVIYNGRSPELFDPDQVKEDYVLSVGRIWDEGKHVSLLLQTQNRNAPTGTSQASVNDFRSNSARSEYHDSSSEGASQLSPGRQPWVRMQNDPSPGGTTDIRIVGWTQEPGRENKALPTCPPNVQLLGPKSQDELRHLYAEASLYAATSRYEPFGLSPLEAALSRCALVMNDIPVFHELWGDAATYFRKDDPADLSRTLNELRQTPDLRNRLANKAFLRACQKFTASRMVAEYESAYHQVASRMEKVA